MWLQYRVWNKIELSLWVIKHTCVSKPRSQGLLSCCSAVLRHFPGSRGPTWHTLLTHTGWRKGKVEWEETWFFLYGHTQEHTSRPFTSQSSKEIVFIPETRVSSWTRKFYDHRRKRNWYRCQLANSTTFLSACRLKSSTWTNFSRTIPFTFPQVHIYQPHGSTMVYSLPLTLWDVSWTSLL